MSFHLLNAGYEPCVDAPQPDAPASGPSLMAIRSPQMVATGLAIVLMDSGDARSDEFSIDH
ncbi:hypothetical protein PAXRUDRAFT_821846 [Paxillus rubicundulus Ve08.2h10]|uniref:Uncharacterized protein n=1 Tax=Paxillus rubicundulus Ve08.2h10 TaxID=930991 RepID=A0A0D0E5W5_9AGAM|nr:hypothetical protein PAXRUDRAFT_821846 [Paxillus rubicundulus Ve08.2h10]